MIYTAVRKERAKETESFVTALQTHCRANILLVGTSMINRDQASRLVNKTVPVPDKDGQYDGTYVIMLGVFHQLHCVVRIFRAPFMI